MIKSFLPAAILLTIPAAYAQESAHHEVWTLPSGTQIGAITNDSAWTSSIVPKYEWPTNTDADDKPGVASIESLANPLKGRSLRLIQDAAKEFEGQRLVEGFKILQAALGDPAAKPYALLMLGTEHLKQAKLQPELLPMVVQELRQGLAALPDQAAAHSNLALALWISGDLEEALKEAKTSVRLDPSVPKSRYALGEILLTLGQVQDAKYQLRVAATEVAGAQQLLDSLQP